MKENEVRSKRQGAEIIRNLASNYNKTHPESQDMHRVAKELEKEANYLEATINLEKIR